MYVNGMAYDFSVNHDALAAVVRPVIQDEYGDAKLDDRTLAFALQLGSSIMFDQVQFDYEDTDMPPTFQEASLHSAVELALSGFMDEAANFPTGELFAVRSELLATRLTNGILGAVMDGRLAIEVEESYDSCGGCYGYHSVNYDCDRDQHFNDSPY